jgi:hypothetical protein
VKQRTVRTGLDVDLRLHFAPYKRRERPSRKGRPLDGVPGGLGLVCAPRRPVAYRL